MTQLVLVGGGHTHVQVLRHIGMNWRAKGRFEDVEVTVVVDRPIAVYSGMVPGFVAGQYREHELEIDVVPLARRAGATVILNAATGIDPQAQEVRLEGRPPIHYDIASLDIGSTVAGLDLPGVREHALPTRPISGFVHRVQATLEKLEAKIGPRLSRMAVVGGGAGGVELAFCLQRRLPDTQIALVHGGPTVLEGYPASLVRRVEAHARARGIELMMGRRAAEVHATSLELDDGTLLEDTGVVWVAGAVAHRNFDPAPLPTDARGFLKTRNDLRVEGSDRLFAVGDCATLTDHPETPKAGVYAVRQGPFLNTNIEALLQGRPLRPYSPQSDFLTLLNLGDDLALGAKWGRSFEGRWVLRLKDRIDRKFMTRFQVLDHQAALQDEFPKMDGMDEMLCGGCAAKVGQSSLERALGRLPVKPRHDRVILGVEEADDAAAWRTQSGDAVVTSVDAFRAFSSDAYLVGQVAAVNATNDVWAKGVRPHTALALVAIPDTASESRREELLFQCLSGVRERLDALGVDLLGGHSTLGPELTIGLAVTGEASSDLLSIDRLRAGDSLICTHAFGTGVLLHADGQGRLPGRWLARVHASMLTDVAPAVTLARAHGVTAATDVTGFGLAGHLGETLRSSGVSAELELDRLPALPGALELLGQGLRSTAHEQNAHARKTIDFRIGTDSDARARAELLFDPQTCGGLLFGVPGEGSQDFLQALHDSGYPSAAVVGHVCDTDAQGAMFRVVPGSLEAAKSPA